MRIRGAGAAAPEGYLVIVSLRLHEPNDRCSCQVDHYHSFETGLSDIVVSAIAPRCVIHGDPADDGDRAYDRARDMEAEDA